MGDIYITQFLIEVQLDGYMFAETYVRYEVHFEIIHKVVQLRRQSGQSILNSNP